MKKIGILTFTYGDNFGQRLQNYALEKYLTDLGCEVCTLKQYGRKKDYKYEVKQFIKSLIARTFSLEKVKRHWRFLKFDQKYIKYYKKKIGQDRIPENLKNEFDYFVTGSDQVWSPFTTDVNDTFFVTFAEKAQRISYAASIAAEYIPEDQQEIYVRRFSGFNRISVREGNLNSWITENTGLVPEVHIDPTLLFDGAFWGQMAKRPKQLKGRKYILFYFLGSNEEKQSLIEKYKLHDYEIIDILNDPVYLNIGPCEFLYLIKNATAVITDSYHGTLFSIQFHRTFVVANRKDKLNNMSSRFNEIFNLLGLYNRLASSVGAEELFNPIDYAKIESVLKEQRKVSLQYFTECLDIK